MQDEKTVQRSTGMKMEEKNAVMTIFQIAYSVSKCYCWKDTFFSIQVASAEQHVNRYSYVETVLSVLFKLHPFCE